MYIAINFGGGKTSLLQLLTVYHCSKYKTVTHLQFTITTDSKNLNA